MDELDDEIRHADKLAGMLRFARKHLDENLYCIAVLGTQITVGDLIDGALSLHEERRRKTQEGVDGTDTPGEDAEALRDTSPGTGATLHRVFFSAPDPEALRKAADAVRKSLDRAIKRTGPFPNEAVLFGKRKPLKVHMFFDQKGATYSSCGHTRRYANTVCKANSEVKHVTTDPRKVTCKTCRRKWKRMTSDG